MSVPQMVTIDLKKLVEGCFTAAELISLAHCGNDPMIAVSEWTNPIMDGLEETHDFEGLVFDYIKENYKGG
jgi:hypothetical protein